MPRYASNIQIPNLPVAITLSGSEQVEIVQAGVSCRTTTAAIASVPATTLIAPAATTAQKNALAATQGQLVFDTDLGKLCVYTGSAWQTITSV